jgi:hypothetical protein
MGSSQTGRYNGALHNVELLMPLRRLRHLRPQHQDYLHPHPSHTRRRRGDDLCHQLHFHPHRPRPRWWLKVVSPEVLSPLRPALTSAVLQLPLPRSSFAQLPVCAGDHEDLIGSHETVSLLDLGHTTGQENPGYWYVLRTIASIRGGRFPAVIVDQNVITGSRNEIHTTFVL